MPRIKTVQQRTTIGELSPKMIGRSDLDQYTSACEKMRNVFTIPQGGFTRRNGLEYIGTLPNATNVRFVDFLFNVDQRYVVMLTPGLLTIYRDGVFVFSITNNFITNSRIPFINYEQVLDTAFLIHPDFSPKRLVRIADNNWTLTDIVFDFIPFYNFIPNDTNPNTSISLEDTSGTFKITAGASTFVSTDVNQYILGNGGKARIVKYISNTVVVVTTNTPFFDKDPILPGDWTLSRGFERVWSNTRGWPVTCTLYNGRLWFGGSKSRPNAIWGSRVNYYYDFNIGSALADDAIDIELDSDQLNPIVNMVASTSLIVFTTGSEHTFVQPFGEPISPENAKVVKQTASGSKKGVRPIVVESGILYIQRDGKSIKEFIYKDTQQSYGNDYVSLMSSHLLVDPIDFAVRLSNNTDEIPYIIVINSDGTAIFGPYLRQENIISCALQITDGKFKTCCYDGKYIYFCVERVINNNTFNFIERFNPEVFTDSSTRIEVLNPTTTFTGLNHLEGMLCKVIADGSVLTDRTVVGGQVTIERPAKNYFEIGLNYFPYVKDLPVDGLVSQGQTLLGRKKSIAAIYINLYETQSIIVNGKLISFRKFGPANVVHALDSTPPSFTGIQKICGKPGWDYTAQIEFTQENPVPMTVLSWSKEVEVS